MRFPPIPEQDWTEAQAAVAGAIRSGPRGELRGPFVPLLYSPELAACIQQTGEYIRFRNSLPPQLIEMAVLMTARRYRCANMWESHRALAIKANIRRDVIVALSKEQRPPDMTQQEEAVFAFCMDLLDSHSVSPASFVAIEQLFGKRGAIDLTGICGYYVMLSLVYNAAEIPLPEGHVRFAP